ncbi:MAG TPA: hypothetical protein VH877_19075 [Polyangia bacterium]|nr:hypothetical protein [Polyangia bacterium]
MTSPVRLTLGLALFLLLPPTAHGSGDGGHGDLGAEFSDCGRCHVPSSWRELRAIGGHAIDHARTGFRLTGRHAGLGCTACHRPDRRLDEPWPGACVTCHPDRLHRGALGNDCARCHTDRMWRLPQGREVHARSRFPLTGAHLAADCTSCHLRADHGVYDDTPVACVACHQAAYGRDDIHPQHVRAGFSTDCSLCHRTSTFRPARFLHANFFPLAGAHASVPCERCHPNERFGGTPRDCAACHLADYQSTTNPNHAQANFPRDCTRCHTPVAWRPARPDWHDTIFPITRGPHRGIACSQCHTVPGDFAIFRCTQCHTAGDTVPAHREVSGFVFEDHACYQCHPRGVH